MALTSLPHIVRIHPEPQTAILRASLEHKYALILLTTEPPPYFPQPSIVRSSTLTLCTRKSVIRTRNARQLARAMSDAYERERQNNSRLDELSAKVSALRGVTIDIYDNARDQGVIDSTVRFFTILWHRAHYEGLQTGSSSNTSLHFPLSRDCMRSL